MEVKFLDCSESQKAIEFLFDFKVDLKETICQGKSYPANIFRLLFENKSGFQQINYKML